MGFPIRKSPDHRLLASSRGLSQLTASFIASLRQGIHTHTLSSLTIKSISNTNFCTMFLLALLSLQQPRQGYLWKACNTCSKYCPSNIQFSKIRLLPDFSGKRRKSAFPADFGHGNDHLRLLLYRSTSDWILLLRCMVGLDRLELSTSPLSGVRSSHLSYRPVDQRHHITSWLKRG